jgi:glycosyltransferase involved in cell wall biosynthesis
MPSGVIFGVWEITHEEYQGLSIFVTLMRITAPEAVVVLLAVMLLAAVLAGLCVYFVPRKSVLRRCADTNPDKTAPGVSIYMPAYTGMEFLEEAISSVLAQTYAGPWEVLLGVNGHAMHSSEWNVAAAQAGRDGRIKLLHFTPPTGVRNKKSWTCNAMNAVALYDTVCMLDCDDAWAPGKLEAQMRIWNTGTVDVVGTQALYFGGGKTGSPDLPRGYFHDSFDFLKANPIINSSAMFRAADAYWSEDHIGVEDYDLWIRLQLLGRRFYNVKEALTRHRLHGGSAFNGSNDAAAGALRAHWHRPASTFKPVTVVTAYYPIPSKFDHKTYMGWIANFLGNVSCHLCIYTPASMVAELRALRTAFADRTEIVPLEFDDLEMASPAWMAVWRHHHTLDPEAYHHSPELYAIWAQKSACVARAIAASKWGSDFYVWCDIGSFRDRDRARALSTFPCPKLVSCLNPQRVCFLRLLGLLGGGIFIAHKDHFHKWHTAYLDYLSESVAVDRYIGQDQLAYMAMFLQHPKLFSIIDVKSDKGDPWFYMQTVFKCENGGVEGGGGCSKPH